MDEHFKVDYSHNKAKENMIFKGDKYRITILTERLIRLEYSENGFFYDGLTEMVINRDFPEVQLQVQEDNKFLEITTKYFKLSYIKNRPFKGSAIAPDSNLKVMLNNTDKMWYFTHPEARNYKGTSVSLDENSSKANLQKGLYSTDGFTSIDDSTSMLLNSDGELSVPKEKRVDTYLFMYRRDFGLALKDYFYLTGKPSLIPRYALGIWWNKDEIYSFEDTKKLIANFSRNKIPLSVLLLGNNWHNKTDLNKTGFTFNETLFPNPSLFTEYMHERGIRVGLAIDPSEGISRQESAYETIKSNLGINTDTNIPFNVFDKNMLMTYFHTVINTLNNVGIDFFWIDYYNPKDLYTLRALNYYHFNDYKKYSSKRGLILSRNGLVASHRLPIHYSGQTIVSWDTLKLLPFYNSSASNIGVSWWSHDIGGYKDGIEDNELYIRYVELATFSPIFRFSVRNGHYYKREPWKWDVQTLNIARDYCVLRHRLIPYLYAEAYKYHTTGLPLVQPLYYQNPEIYDEPLYRNEYYFGKELFVAPITVKKDLVMNRAVLKTFLPSGTWYDFKTGKKFPGDKRYVTFYKDEDYPVFAKSGSIIPMAILEENINVTNPPKDLEIHVFPGKSNTFKLYEDDGYSSLFESGYYILTNIDYNYLQNNYTLIIRPVEGKTGIIPNTRNYKIRFRNTREADDVITYINKDVVTTTNYVEDNDFIVEVKDVPTTSQLTINCKGKDIEIDAVRIINEEVDSIISDLKIETRLKEKIANIFFSDLDIKKKRIQIRKLKSDGLDGLFIRMFLKLLEYIKEI
jgi:alpha-glucosidase (family GH31 glycosyl hydrolase)